ncbi:MAG: sulfatase [Planctomycetota bacterium]
MTGRLFISAALACLGQGVASAEDRPNVLWIMLEDWGPEMSCYGTPGIETPVCDALAAEGVRYMRAFTTSPVCSTSRSAMMTGFHQNTIGAQQHRTAAADKQPLPDGIKSMPELLAEAGYFCCLMNYKKTDCNFVFDAKTHLPFADWSERAEGQPFFAQVTFGGTHRKFKRDPVDPIDTADVELPPYYTDTEFNRRDWANGLEQMQLCDREIGDLLKRLADEGLAENTLVFVIGDHGRCHIRGKQFLYEAGLHIPLLVRWPGRIEPGRVNDDLVSAIDITATILDVAGATPEVPPHGRTLFGDDYEPREYVFAARGRMGDTYDAMRSVRGDRFKLIHNLMPERPWLQRSDYKLNAYPMLAEMSVLHARGELNADQSRFFAATKPEFELFDLGDDPYELNNLADDPAYEEVFSRLAGVLADWRERIGDKGVPDQFRAGGNATYPFLTADEWEALRDIWRPWVFREPGSDVPHPFAGWYSRPDELGAWARARAAGQGKARSQKDGSRL